MVDIDPNGIEIGGIGIKNCQNQSRPAKKTEDERSGKGWEKLPESGVRAKRGRISAAPEGGAMRRLGGADRNNVEVAFPSGMSARADRG